MKRPAGLSVDVAEVTGCHRLWVEPIRRFVRSQFPTIRRPDIFWCTRPKFLTGSDGILLIRQEIIQSSISNYWQQGEQRIGLGLQRSRLWHLLKAWGGVFRFQPIGHAC